MRARRNILTKLTLHVAVGVAAMALVAAAGPAQASFFDVFFDVTVDTTSGPPYPTADPLVVKVFDKSSPLLDELPLEEVSFRFGDGMEEVPMLLYGSDSGGGVGSAGATANLELSLTGPEPPPETLMFDMFLQLASPSGVSSIVSEPVQYGATDFDLYFDVEMANGWVIGNRLHGSLGSSQPLTIAAIDWDFVPAEAYDCFLHLDMGSSGLIDAASPILALELTGTYVPEPATLAVLAVGGLVLVRRRRA